MKSFQCIVLASLLALISTNQNKSTIYLLTMLPYPNQDPDFHPFWEEGDNIRPALELAKDQINNSSSLLQNYSLQLVHADGGCQVATTTTTSFVSQVFHPDHRKRVITGVIGPGCSFAVAFLGNLTNRTKLSMVHVHGAGSPVLTDRNLYHYMLGLLGSPSNYVEGFLYFMRQANWNKVAILYDDSRNYFLNAKRQLVAKKEIKPVFLSPASSTFIPLKAIQDAKLRIIFVLCSLQLTRQIICLAYHNRMIYENYQWVVIDQHLMELSQPIIDFEYDRVTYSCSTPTMLEALNKAILMTYRLTPSSDSVISNITYEKFLLFYEQYREAYNYLEPRRFSKQKNSTYTYWATYLYDAVWAWALVLDNLTKYHDGFDLYSDYGNTKQANMILKQFYQTKFDGMSGEIDFNSSTGFIERGVNLTLVEENKTILLATITRGEITIENSMPETLISDTFPVTKVSRNLGIFFALLVLIQASVTVLFHILTIVYHIQKRPSIKASSPRLLHISYIGNYIIAVGTFLWAFNSAAELDVSLRPYFCQILWVWCLPTGFVLSFAPVAMRTWRIYRIFKHYLNPGPLISDRILIIGVLLLLLGILVIAVTWTIIDPFRLDDKASSNGKVVYLKHECKSAYHNYWYAALTVYLGLLVLLTTALLFLTRNIPNKTFTTVTLRVLCCTIALLGFPFYYFTVLQVFDPIYNFVCLCILIHLMLAAFVMCIFLPPLLPIFGTYRIKKGCNNYCNFGT